MRNIPLKVMISFFFKTPSSIGQDLITINRFLITILFVRPKELLLFCIMKLIAILLLLISTTLVSCTSEYEERLAEGRYLIQKLAIVEQNDGISNEIILKEIEEINKEIKILSKISDHEELFLREILEN